MTHASGNARLASAPRQLRRLHARHFPPALSSLGHAHHTGVNPNDIDNICPHSPAHRQSGDRARLSKNAYIDDWRQAMHRARAASRHGGRPVDALLLPHPIAPAGHGNRAADSAALPRDWGESFLPPEQGWGEDANAIAARRRPHEPGTTRAAASSRCRRASLGHPSHKRGTGRQRPSSLMTPLPNLTLQSSGTKWPRPSACKRFQCP